jgi:hypothetical protein
MLTVALSLAQLAAIYVGPSLIDHFVEFIRQGGTPWEGLRLVLTLLGGKAVQTLASHHYNFQGQLLGMRIHDAVSKGKSVLHSCGHHDNTQPLKICLAAKNVMYSAGDLRHATLAHDEGDGRVHGVDVW